MKQVLKDNEDMIGQENILKKQDEKIKESREKLLDKYLDGKISDDIYQMKDEKFKKEQEKINIKLKEVQKKKEGFLNKTERFKKLEREIEEISDRDLSIANMEEHIEKIIVYPQYLLIQFDIFNDLKIEVIRKSYKCIEYNICL